MRDRKTHEFDARLRRLRDGDPSLDSQEVSALELAESDQLLDVYISPMQRHALLQWRGGVWGAAPPVMLDDEVPRGRSSHLPLARVAQHAPRFSVFVAAVAIFSVLLIAAPFAAARTGAEPLDFNRDIRPILAENCFYCHGQDANKREADLRLDLREAAVESGAILPGDPDGSGLLERINATDAEMLMPPPDSNRRLSPAQRRLLARWIAEGAEYESHWAFVAPVRPAVPEVKQAAWVRNAIDRFVLAKLEARGLAPSPEAHRSTLIRRLYLDLVGLPPTPEEVDAFVNDSDPHAYEKLVDRLLASPHYGERMALPWLDAARYADSNGFQQDGDTWQWIWRDWVVQSLNADLPFDQFTIEQLAGDLLPNPTIEQKIASGFNRNHLLNGEGGAIAEEQRFNNLFDRLDTTSTTWLGLTMACAQCHDHKYDPITQQDYYRLLDLFNRVPESGVPQDFSRRIRVAPPILELPTAENKAKIADLESQIAIAEKEAAAQLDAEFAKWRAELAVRVQTGEEQGFSKNCVALLRKPEAERTEEERGSLETELRKHFEGKVKPGLVKKLPAFAEIEPLKKQLKDYRGDQIPRVMMMSDDRPRETKILDRGDYLSPKGDKLEFAPPAFLPPLPERAPRNRLGFAQWLFTPEQPLTARVRVNQMWQHFFGVGIVKTTEDLGVQSEYPTHLHLLDWLAMEFRDRGWSQKQMHRLIVTSATYRQSSRITAAHQAHDPENRLFTRAPRFRMPSMILRDVALASSGLLDTRIGGKPVYPYQPEQIWESLAITKERDFTYPGSHGADLYRRSLYTFWRRTVSPANLFDSANRQTCSVRSGRTSTPLHALTTLNDPTWVEAARVLAEKSMQRSADLDEQLTFAFRRVVSRQPTAQDLAALRKMHERQLAFFTSDPEAAKQLLGAGESPRDEALDVSRHAALSAVCLAILNLDEALTRE